MLAEQKTPPASIFPLTDPSFMHPPLLLPLSFYDVTLSAQELWAVLSPFVCRALKLKPLCLRVPICLGSPLRLRLGITSAVPIKDQLPLFVVGTSRRASPRTPPAKCLAPMLSVRTRRR